MNPPPLTDENIRAALLQMAQEITTQEKASTTQDQAWRRKLIGRLYPERTNKLLPWPPDLTRMNPPTFYRSNVEKEPHDFIDKIYKIL